MRYRKPYVAEELLSKSSGRKNKYWWWKDPPEIAIIAKLPIFLLCRKLSANRLLVSRGNLKRADDSLINSLLFHGSAQLTHNNSGLIQLSEEKWVPTILTLSYFALSDNSFIFKILSIHELLN